MVRFPFSVLPRGLFAGVLGAKCGLLLVPCGLVACGDSTAARSGEADDSPADDDAEASDDDGADDDEGSREPASEPSTSAGDAGTSPPDVVGPLEPSVTPEPVLEPDGPAAPCERALTFEAVELETPPPFDVVIIADHSDSLSWSREDLASGLDSLLDRVRGHDARFHLLTPTQYGASSANAIDMVTGEELVAWKDPTTGLAYTHEVTEYSTACAGADGRAITCPATPVLGQTFTLTGTWRLKLGGPVAEIGADMSDAEFDAEASALRDAILGLAGGGSQDEQPMCTLHRYLAQDPELLPENVVFIVLSDEEDQSSPSDCLASYHYESGTSEYIELVPGCLEDCPVYQYETSVELASRALYFTCVPVDDLGNRFPERARSAVRPLQATQDCGGTTSRECTSSELADAESECGPATVVEGCTSTCREGGAEKICLLQIDEPGLDPCTQPFEKDGTGYEDFADYCQAQLGEGDFSECEGEGLFEVPRRSAVAGGHARGLLESSRLVDVIDDFKKKAEARWGDRHFVEVITFAEEFACVPGTGQSYASTLRYVASTQQDVFPICEPYAPALARVEDFSRTLLETEYALELAAGEAVEGVEVTDADGAMRELDAAEYGYDEEAGRLRIDASALTPRDVALTVQVARRCGLAR